MTLHKRRQNKTGTSPMNLVNTYPFNNMRKIELAWITTIRACCSFKQSELNSPFLLLLFVLQKQREVQTQ